MGKYVVKELLSLAHPKFSLDVFLTTNSTQQASAKQTGTSLVDVFTCFQDI